MTKVEPARRAPVDEEPARGQGQVRLGEDVFQEPDLVEEARGARLQDLAAELAVECLVPLEHDHLGPALGQEQAEEQSGGATAHHADVGLRGRHVDSHVDHMTRRHLAEESGHIRTPRPSRPLDDPAGQGYPAELKSKLDAGEDLMLVDLRHPVDFDAEPSIIPGALHLTTEELEARHLEIPRHREIVLYCT